MGQVCCVIETANKIMEETLPTSALYRYAQKRKKEALIKKHDLLNHEYPGKQESATIRWNEYQQMTPEQRRRRYAKEEL
jgi:hypothetical protein